MPTTPYMNMLLPTVQVTLDPTWASELNDALTNQLDAHDHTTGKGVKVPSAGLNINADLSFQSNDATNLRSVALNNNVSTLPSGDIRCVYASGGNLYYNNNSGIPIQLTTGSSINTGALALNVWAYQSVSTNLTIPNNASYIYLGTDTSSARTITLPAANQVTAGRYFIVKDKTGSAATNNITVTPAGSDTIDTSATSAAINFAFGSEMFVSDGVSDWTTFKEGSPGATATVLGTIKLAGDLAGSGSTFNTPRVIDCTTSVKGKILLAGDLAGDGSTSDTPRINSLKGISGIVTGPLTAIKMGINPATDGYGIRLGSSFDSTLSGVTVRDSNNFVNLNAIGVSDADVVVIGNTSTVNNIRGGIEVQNTSPAGNITIDDGTTYHCLVFVDTSAARDVNLPAASTATGRIYIIKDKTGTAATNNITLVRDGSEKIEGVAANKALATNWGSWTITSNGTDWFFI